MVNNDGQTTVITTGWTSFSYIYYLVVIPRLPYTMYGAYAFVFKLLFNQGFRPIHFWNKLKILPIYFWNKLKYWQSNLKN